MEDKSNIITYIEESVLKKIDESKKDTYRLLGRAFEELGDKALYMSHIDFSKYYEKLYRKVSAGGTSLAADILDGADSLNMSNETLANLAKAFGQDDASTLDKDERDSTLSQFSVGELEILKDKDN